MLIVPLPGVPPLALTALGMPSGNMNVKKLMEPGFDVYLGLRAAGIIPITNAADGAQVE